MAHRLHGPIDAALAFQEDGVDPTDVTAIEVETYRSASYHDNTSIDNVLDAQMSLPYGVAIALATGETSLDAFDPGNAARNDVAQLMDRTTVTATDEMERRYPQTRPATVTVETTDGQQFERFVEYPRGAAESPLSREEITAKFRDLSGSVLDSAAQDAVLDRVFSLTTLDSVSSLTSKL